ncbi:MAG TPA: M28 family peptidase [Candidatus Angelobacter sp.]|nr:M28 family peptidase [Candidatus Angelobacter sp.]
MPACNKTKTASASSEAPASQAAQQQPAALNLSAEPVGPALHVDPARAWQYTKEIFSLGPRWDGSKGQEKLGQYLHKKFANDMVEEDAFQADTPVGKLPVRNIVVRFPGTKDGIIVLGSHIDTNYTLRNTNYAGANDGSSSTALLLAIADQLRGKKLEGYSVWLAFLDGEEAVEHWSATDSLYGSRHLAAKWQQDGTLPKVRAFLLADMIAVENVDVLRDENSTPWLQDVVYQAATRLGYQSHFYGRTSAIEDDHLPFHQSNVPVADLIDMPYGYNDVYHHTTEDTLDKLSPKSLQITGDVILESIRLLNANADHLPVGSQPAGK